MAFGKKDHLIGLDIGSRSIKVAEIEETKRGSALKNIGSIDIAHGAIEEGTINDPETVAESLQQLLKSCGIKENNVAVSIGGYSVIVKKIIVQTMAEEQLQETIHFEAEQYIPFDISDVNLDFQILGEIPASSMSKHSPCKTALKPTIILKRRISPLLTLAPVRHH